MDLKRSSGPAFGGKGAWMRLSSPLSSCILEASSIPGGVIAVNGCCCKKFMWDETFPSATYASCPFASPCGSLWRQSLHPICNHPLSSRVLCWGSSCAFREKRPNSFCLSSQGRLSSPLIFAGLLWTHFSLSASFMNCGDWNKKNTI